MSAAPVRIDHVVLVVTSLADAVPAFVAAGFTVTPGGRHDTIPTENALVCFRDGSYLELLAAREPSTRDELRGLRASVGWERHLKGVSAVARRFLPHLAGPEGVADWVLRGEALERLAAALRTLGIKAAGPLAMGRERADGVKLEWRLLLPEARLHPFWIADRTPRELRVPGDARATTHANGASGIAAVRVCTPAVALQALALGEALGAIPRQRADVTVLELEAGRVEVVEGEPEGACGAVIAGCGPLPPVVTALGVTAER